MCGYIDVGCTVSAGVGGQQYMYRLVVPPNGSEVDMMGVDRLIQSMTEGGVRAGEQVGASGIIILV